MRTPTQMIAALSAASLLLASLPGCAPSGRSLRDVPALPADLSSASAALEKRLAEGRADAALYGELALLRLRQGRKAEAARQVSRALALSPRDAVSLAIAGKVAAARGKHEMAVRFYEDAYRWEPAGLGERAREGRLTSSSALARFHLEAGRTGDALALVRRAAGWLDPASPKLASALADLADDVASQALRQGARDIALSAWDIAREIADDDLLLARVAGRLAALKGDHVTAERELAHWADRSSARWASVASFYEQLSETERALEAWRRATVAKDAASSTWTALARAALAAGHPVEAAQAHIESLAELKTPRERADRLITAAQRLRDQGHDSAAATLVAAAHAATPDYWPAARARIVQLASEDVHDKMATLLTSYIARTPDPEAGLRNVSELLVSLGLVDEAVRFMEHALAQDNVTIPTQGRFSGSSLHVPPAALWQLRGTPHPRHR